MGRAPCCEKVGLKQGKWTQEEDEILANYIKAHGEGSWRSLPKRAGLLRCGKSCRLRWINYLRAGLKRGSFSSEEDELIIKLHATLGNRWSLIANKLPGRTDNDIKNYWNSHLSRSIQSYNHASLSGNTESMKPLKNSKMKVEKNNEKITQPTKQTKKKLTVHKALNPETSSKDSNENVQSEFSSLSDEVSCNSNDDFLNGPFSPIILDNSDFWGLEPIETPSDYSCTTNEVSTSKEEIINGPSSPDLSSIFKELDELLNSEINEINVEQGGHNNMSAHAENCLFVQKEARMEEQGYFGDLGCSDSLWDLDLWSSMRPLEGDLVLY